MTAWAPKKIFQALENPYEVPRYKYTLHAKSNTYLTLWLGAHKELKKKGRTKGEKKTR